MEKMPPIAKIYEAYSCIADERVLVEENEAIVTSSDGKKQYKVTWKDNTYVSNDNASFWQGYPGYPVIAVLMLQHKLPFHKETAILFKNINWHALNEKYKRNYDKAVEEVLSQLNTDTKAIKKETKEIYETLKTLPLEIKRKLS